MKMNRDKNLGMATKGNYFPTSFAFSVHRML